MIFPCNSLHQQCHIEESYLRTAFSFIRNQLKYLVSWGNVWFSRTEMLGFPEPSVEPCFDKIFDN
jgi:hypothetical protein